MTNLEKYQTVLEHENLDAILVSSETNRQYLTRYPIAEGIALVSKNGCRYFTDSRYIEDAQRNLHEFEVIQTTRDRSQMRCILDTVQDFQIKRMGFEERYLTVSDYRAYGEGLHVELVPCQAAIDTFRAVKEDWEKERLLKAQEITDRAFSEILEKIRPGMTEKALEAELIYCLYRNGADGLSFSPIVVSGENTSLPHGVAGERIFSNGDFITMDFGVVYDGYCSDMTRTVALGCVTDEMKRVYDTVLQAQTTAIAQTKAGMTGCEIDAIARKVIEDAGYGTYFGHGYGHSLGIEIHESPNCSPSEQRAIPAGAVCSAEPGIYLPGKFGVRIEDVIFVQENGCMDITQSPKHLIVI